MTRAARVATVARTGPGGAIAGAGAIVPAGTTRAGSSSVPVDATRFNAAVVVRPAAGLALGASVVLLAATAPVAMTIEIASVMTLRAWEACDRSGETGTRSVIAQTPGCPSQVAANAAVAGTLD